MTADGNRAAVEGALAAIIETSTALKAVKRSSLSPSVAVDLARIYAGALRLKATLGTLLQNPAPVDQLFARPGVRHELNTPLNHIIGYSELLMEEESEAAAAMFEELKAIHTAARTMFRVVNPAAIQSVATPPAPPPGEIGKLLLVDDDPDHRELLRRHVTQLGHRTLEAEHGRKALEILEKERPDVILLDIHMPIMDGFETLRTLKEHPALREIPVIMLSALDEVASVAKCIEMGAEDYLHKPANAVLLNARIAGTLARKRSRDQELDYFNAVADVSAAAVAMEMEVFDPSMLDDVAARQDAVGHLARVFQSMARAIHSR